MGFLSDLGDLFNTIGEGFESANDELIIAKGLSRLNNEQLDNEERAELLEEMARAARHIADYFSN